MFLVTGCAGFIGSHLGERLLQEGHTVQGLDNFDDYYQKNLKTTNLELLRKNKSFSFATGSITDEATLQDSVKDVTTIFHQAGMAGVRASVRNPAKYFKTNVFGTAMILDAARRVDVETVVMASSSSIYGDVSEKNLPVKETDKPNPISPYAMSKLQAENVCETFPECYGIRTVCLRYFTVYGPRQRPDEGFSKFITAGLTGEQVEIYGDGEQTRDFTYVGDIVDGNLLAAKKGSGAYNLGGGRRITVNEVLEIISSAMDKKIDKIHVAPAEGDVLHTGADITKAKLELGYEPKISLEAGIRKHVEWFRSRRN